MTEDFRAPSKLTNDAIVEALVEIRFREPAVPEVFFGRVADHAHWAQWVQRRLPAYDIPSQIRETEVALRYAPIIELLEPNGQGALRIGARVASLHRTKPYPGWNVFRVQIAQVVKTLFETNPLLSIERVGVRYLNALQTKTHFIASARELTINISDGEQDIEDSFNLNFSKRLDEDSRSTVRIATVDFVQGELPPDAVAVVDIDVFSDNFFPKKASDVEDWVEKAHEAEKRIFFRLLPQSILERLKET